MSHTASIESELAEANKRCEQLKQQAEIWAQEARTQTATVHECYAACGIHGKATFNGAEPVRKHVANLESELAIMRDFIKSHGLMPPESEAR